LKLSEQVTTLAAKVAEFEGRLAQNSRETGMRVAGKLYWLHVLVTPELTWLGSHANRGKQAFDAFG